MSNVSENTRVSPKQILKDIESYHALCTLTDYKANNPANSREAADAAYKRLREAEQNAVATQVAAAAGADALAAARRDIHDVILGAKNEAKALYGPSSDQVAALGLKKKSEFSRRSKSKKETPAG
ncbi:hypothetical protein [Zoogloea sp.]|uniref:hypothetical protein n=1 Tax=Zoogloea sp. TaxID=49181 RepID=UPI0035B20D0F